MTIYTGIFAISEATPFFDAIFGARIAAFILWKIIDDVCFTLSLLSCSVIL